MKWPKHPGTAAQFETPPGKFWGFGSQTGRMLMSAQQTNGSKVGGDTKIGYSAL